MRRLLGYTALLVALNLVLVGARLGHSAATPQGKRTRVGLVFDVGGRGDKSFNDAAWRGLDRAVHELGVEAEYIEPGEGSDRESGIRLLAAEKFDLIIGVGFIFSDDLIAVANEYPNVHFACIDYAKFDKNGAFVAPPKNMVALKFREEEGAFLVGALAALRSYAHAVGFVGGMDIPLIHKFEAGYRAGVQYVCPNCKVMVGYAGVTGDSFKNPAKGKELALAQYAAGADIVFHAAGTTGLGAFEAAREQDKLAIGVDSDQWDEAPGHILTSMTKQVDVSVLETVRRVRDRQWRGGVQQFGLKEKAVDYVYDAHNRALVGDAVRERVEQLRAKVVAGEIKVPDR
jgi:basic membrane protein A